MHRILIIDDDRIIRKGLVNTFLGRKNGFDLLERQRMENRVLR